MKVNVTLTLDSDRDRDIMRWLESQANRSAAVREAIRGHMNGTSAATLDDVLREIRDLRRAGLVASGANQMAPGDEPADVAATLDDLGL